jgi:hypothetical protein
MVVWVVIDHVGMGQLGGIWYTIEEAEAYIVSKPQFGHELVRCEVADMAVAAPAVPVAASPMPQHRSEPAQQPELAQRMRVPVRERKEG